MGAKKGTDKGKADKADTSKKVVPSVKPGTKKKGKPTQKDWKEQAEKFGF